METLYPKSESSKDNYESLITIIPFYLNSEDPWITNLSNFVALVNYYMDDINWCGVYLNENDALILGPFQGKPACTRIEKGRGVCGTAFEKETPIRVDDVSQYPGHIACDDASQSEIVIPLMHEGSCLGVLDIDAPVKNRFTPIDQTCLEKTVKAFVDKCAVHPL